MAIESDLHNKYSLWMERPVTETLDLYADWAANYDSDLAKAGYFTPSRIAAALIKVTIPDKKSSRFWMWNWAIRQSIAIYWVF